MPSIKWQRGTFQTLYANVRVRVGGTHDTAIEKGDSFEYDGTILKYAGMELNSISLRGAVERDWASLSLDSDQPQSIHASRSVAKSQTVNKDLSRVERLSSNSITSDSLDENTVMDISDRRSSDTSKKVLGVPLNNSSPKAITRNNMSISSEDAYAQEGVTVGRLRTSAKLDVDVTKDSGKSASKLENLSGSGFIRETIEKEGVSISMNTKKMSNTIEVQDELEGTTVASVRHTDKETLKKTNGKLNKKLNPKLRIARVIDPSFPLDWSFAGKLAERLQRAKEHGDTATFIQALYAAEGDQMRKLLEKEYPKVVL